MKYNRRSFIKQSALATAGSLLIPGFLKAYERNNLQQGLLNKNQKILVVIQLSGGNDGLNTVVPYQNDIYYKNRPSIAVPQAKVLKLTDEVGLNPALEGLREIFDQGNLAVINNVGYPNPDRSHFRSMDIWHSASSHDEYWNTGWIGRYLDSACSDCDNSHYAIEADDTLSLAMKGKHIKGIAAKDPGKLYASSKKAAVYLKDKPAEKDNDNLHYLYKTLAETVSSSEYIYEKYKVYKSNYTYPQNEFAKRLQTISGMIQSGLETKVYYVSLSGFDTHAQQNSQQERLLKIYADSVKAFVGDLKKNNYLNQVAVMTFSEFGRRLSENANKGTDHGTANNLFVISGNLKKQGVFNPVADLSNLKQGDLKYNTDFRNIYATFLEKWLDTQSDKVLVNRFKPMDFI